MRALELHATTRVAVRVTFLRMTRRAATPRQLPPDCDVVAVDRCTVPFYRFLYNTVGGPWLWWLRRSLRDEVIAATLSQPGVSVHVLYRGGAPAGFFELDSTPAPTVNISYFGLMPEAIGLGIGRAFLDCATERAWALGARALTVNTCTADHQRALPNYLDAGFQTVRAVDEMWDVPNHLGLTIPPHLRS